MKKLVLFFAMFFFSLFAFAQIDFQYGITLGASRNLKNTHKESISAQQFNTLHINDRYGYTSPVLGLHAHANYKLFYASLGVEYNRLKVSYYHFDEYGYYTLDNHDERFVNKYYSESFKTYSYSKLNIPLELGIQFFKDKMFSPFVFGGVNMNYLLDGSIKTTTNNQDPQTKIITSTSNHIDAFNQHDDYELRGKRLRPQRLFGVGLQIKKHFSIKASIRSQIFIYLNEIPKEPQYWNCFGGDYNMYQSKEYLLTFQYHF